MTTFSPSFTGRGIVSCLFHTLVLLAVLGGVPDSAHAQRCATCNRHQTAGHCNCCPAPAPYPGRQIVDGVVDCEPGADTRDSSATTPGEIVGSGQADAVPDELMNIPQDFGQVDASDLQNVGDAPSISSGQLAASFGGGAASPGVPSMIGDFFGGSYQYAFLTNGSGSGHGGTTVAIAGGDRQFKFAENNSPFPQDRVFFNYHHFHNAVQDVNGRDRNLDRYVFGLEKTFMNGWGSFEIRTPFANTVSSSPDLFSNNLTDTEFGNIALAVKGLVARTQCSAISLGLGIVLPTGSDYVIEDTIPNEFQNESVHLQPFVGIYRAPSNRSFSQFFMQFDFAANGSDVTLDQTTASLTTQSLLMLDYSWGYWVVRNRCAKYLRGLAPMLELHYTTTLEDQDYGPFRGQGFFVEDDRRDVLNITGGLFFQIADLSSLKVGVVSPLRTDTDKLFDSEIGVQFVRRY